MEAKLALARLLQTFNIQFPEDYKIETIARLVLQPRDDIKCTFTTNNENSME